MTTYEIITLFVFGLLLLIKGGDLFVDSASAIAKRFHIPEILIGATVVSIGTTLPEVMVSSAGAIAGSGAMAYGNALGSIICNTALICAVTLTFKPSDADRKIMAIPVAFFFGAFAFYVFCAYTFQTFNRWSGIVLLCVFVLYMVLTVYKALHKTDKLPLAEKTDVPQQETEKEKPIVLQILFLIFGAGLIAWGADLLVDNGIRLATVLGVPDSVIALTFVALGTSLPELVTAITSLVKGHGALSLGNIIGANLFNLVLVSGLSVTIAPFAVPVSGTLFGVNSSFIVDIPVAFLVMTILTVPTLITGKLKRWQGILLLAIYTAFVVFQFTL